MTPRIVTVTLNPAIDLAVGLARLTPGNVHRADTAAMHAGGKGINVAACLADWGHRATAAGLIGRDNSASFETLFAAKGVADAMVRLAGKTRINVKLAEAGGRTTDVNLPGLPTTSEDIDQVRASLDRLEPEILVLAGSLPEDLDPVTWADMAAEWRGRGARIVMDVSGDALTLALAGPRSRPHVLKPNRDELSALAGVPLDNAGLLQRARLIRASGVALTVVSLGSRGALFVGEEGVVHAAALPVDAGSSVGAGDAMVAGLTAALVEGTGIERTARLGTAFAAGKLRVPGPHLPPRAEIEALAAQVQLMSADDWIGAGEAAG